MAVVTAIVTVTVMVMDVNGHPSLAAGGVVGGGALGSATMEA